MKKRLVVLVGLVLCIAVASVSNGAGGVKPPQSKAYGKSLGEWMQLYWTWFLGGDQDEQEKKVVFLPLPDGAPISEECPFYLVGELDVNLQPGDKFALPMFVWVGEEYPDGTEDDPDFPLPEAFTSADVLVKLDGNPIIDSEVDDMADFFFDAQYFDPPISYGDGQGGAIWVKGIGFVHKQLPKGEYTLTLFVDTGIVLDSEKFPDCTLVFDNTWYITVE